MSDVQLYLGDCLEILPTLEAGSVDAVITSPPYAEQRSAQYGGISEGEYPAWAVSWMDLIAPMLSQYASVAIVIREHVRGGQISDYVHRTRMALRAAGWLEHDELIWRKTTSPPVGRHDWPRRAWERILWFGLTSNPRCFPKANGHYSKDVGMTGGQPDWVAGVNRGQCGIARCVDLVSTAVGSAADGHPAAFPPELPAWLVRLLTANDGMVLDPFMGSGTTGVACVKTGRKFIGIEIDPDYYAIAEKRIAQAQMQPRLEGL